MRHLLFVPLVLLFALLSPAPASAVTINEIISLSKAGVSEPVILALIDRDKTVFTLSAEQLVTLQKAGVTDTIVIAMLRAGSEEPRRAAVPTAPIAEPEPLPEPLPPPEQPAPSVVNVPYAVPYYVPVPVVVAAQAPRPQCAVRIMATNGEPVTATTGMFFKQPMQAVAVCPPEAPHRPARK
jgi:hypothetical protein